jgi:hypothetical protein
LAILDNALNIAVGTFGCLFMRMEDCYDTPYPCDVLLIEKLREPKLIIIYLIAHQILHLSNFVWSFGPATASRHRARGCCNWQAPSTSISSTNSPTRKPHVCSCGVSIISVNRSFHTEESTAHHTHTRHTQRCGVKQSS